MNLIFTEQGGHTCAVTAAAKSRAETGQIRAGEGRNFDLLNVYLTKSIKIGDKDIDGLMGCGNNVPIEA